MCRSCANHTPSRQEPCAFCGKVAIAAARTTAGAECGSLPAARRMRSQITCERCRARPPVRRPARGVRAVRRRARRADLRGSAAPRSRTTAPGRCGACSLQARVHELAAAPASRSAWRGSEQLSRGAGRQAAKPLSTLNWITTSRGYQIAPRAHQRRDRRSPTRRSTRLNRGSDQPPPAELVSHGALPERSERTAELALLIEPRAAARPRRARSCAPRDLRDLEGPPRPRPHRAREAARRHSDMRARVKSASPPTCSSGSPSTTSRSPPSNRSTSTGGSPTAPASPSRPRVHRLDRHSTTSPPG